MSEFIKDYDVFRPLPDMTSRSERADLCVAALDGLTNEQVGKLGALFRVIREGDPEDVNYYGRDVAQAARAAGIIKE